MKLDREREGGREGGRGRYLRLIYHLCSVHTVENGYRIDCFLNIL